MTSNEQPNEKKGNHYEKKKVFPFVVRNACHDARFFGSSYLVVPTEDYEVLGKHGFFQNYISYCFREVIGFTENNGYTLFESAVKSAKENGIDLTVDGALYEETKSRRSLTIGYQNDSTISVTTNLDLTYEELLAISRPMEIPVN